MTRVAETVPVTEAVLEAVGEIPNPAGGLVQVGDAARPPSPAKPPVAFFPYAVVYTAPVLVDGSLGEPKVDGLHRVQVTCVGRDRRGAEWLADEVRGVLVHLYVDGHKVVSTDVLPSPPIFRDDDVSPPLFVAAVVVNVYVAPISGW